MGKRKRTADINTPPPSDFRPHSPQVERSFDQGESSSMSPNHGFNRGIFLKHPRHYLGRHYSRRSLNNHNDASTSNWNGAPVYDAKLSLNMASKDHNDYHYSGRDGRDRTFQKFKRIRSSSLSSNEVSSDVRKMDCGICQKLLRKKPFVSENSLMASTDLSVVAVLVCGHAYHADCLENKTSHEERWDPPCPLC